MTMRSRRLPLLAATFLLALGPLPATAQRAPDRSPRPPAELQAALETLAQKARPGVFGISVLDLQNGSACRVNATRPYPMMSVFKAPVAAAVLARVDAGTLMLAQTVTLTRADVDPGSAVPSIGENFRGERMTFTVDRLLTAAVSESDNTAVDALIKLVGGPGAVRAFLGAHGVAGMRIEADEAEVGRVFAGLGGRKEPPAGETPEQRARREQEGYRAFLSDPRNDCTPDAAVAFLQKLRRGELLSQASTRRLLDLMAAQTVPRRLRDGLPPEVHLADKSGSGPTVDGKCAAYNDIGILTWPDGHTVLVAAFLTDSEASRAERDALFADLARVTVKTLSVPPGPRPGE